MIRNLNIGDLYYRKAASGVDVVAVTAEIIGDVYSKSGKYTLTEFEPIPVTSDVMRLLSFDLWFNKVWKRNNFYFNQHTNKQYDNIAEANIGVPISYVHELQHRFLSFTGVMLLPGSWSGITFKPAEKPIRDLQLSLGFSSYIEKYDRCCGRCDGVNDICIADKK